MKKLLITGQHRTGTSFLSNFLNGQQNFLVYRDFLGSIFSTSRKLGIKSFKKNLTEREKNIILSKLKIEFLSADENSNQIPKKQDFSNLNGLFEESIKLLTKDKKVDVAGVKVTGQEKWINSLLKSTDIFIIYIYRDIRDILLSSKNRFTNYSTIPYLLKTEKNIKKIIEIKNERLLKIKFEDLIIDSDRSIKKISRFLDEKIIKDIKKAEDRKGQNFIDNSSFHDIDKLFDPKACFRWKKHTKSKEVKYTEILASDLMEKLDYNISRSYSLKEKIPVYSDLYKQKSKNFLKKTISKVINI